MSGPAKCPLDRSPVFSWACGAHLRNAKRCGSRVTWGSQSGCWEFRGREGTPPGSHPRCVLLSGQFWTDPAVRPFTQFPLSGLDTRLCPPRERAFRSHAPRGPCQPLRGW